MPFSSLNHRGQKHAADHLSRPSELVPGGAPWAGLKGKMENGRPPYVCLPVRRPAWLHRLTRASFVNCWQKISLSRSPFLPVFFLLYTFFVQCIVAPDVHNRDILHI